VTRTIAAALAAGATLLTLTVAGAGPAAAHGAPTNPISRAAACGPEGGAKARSRACQAAGVRAAWDNLRLAGVRGRDRQVIPDGRLCSAGLPAYRGLDLARTDWPATRLTAGARYAFKYRGTIPHKGTFKLYVTKPGYDPSKPLRWSDLEPKPFLKVTDPVLRDGSYVMKGRLPKGRTGRHLIYTIWQNSDTPDTYYSCSDVIFRAPRPAQTSAPNVRTVAAAREDDAAPGGARGTSGRRIDPLVLAGTASLAVAAGLTGVAALLRRPTGRREPWI
jgi:chitin-binding protein